MYSRRSFTKAILERSALLAIAPAVPGFIAATARAAGPARDGRVLVVIQLSGGNDGINTVVPYRDEGYAKHRKALRLPADKVLRISDAAGLHPSMTGAARLLERGELAIVQAVGYPNPSRSHFRSMAIWHSARPDPESGGGPGWLGRVFDQRLKQGDKAGAFYLGAGQPPAAVCGRRSVAATLERPEDLLLDSPAHPRTAIGDDRPAGELAEFTRRTALDAYATADGMAAMARADRSTSTDVESLRGRLALIGRLIKSGAVARVYYTEQSGYDTHAGQLVTHSNLLAELSTALESFQSGLSSAGLADRVAVLCFSEFGRRVAENGSHGTDHGTAGPVFLAGRHVRPGLVGHAPSLLDLDDGDLKMTVDFRRVYAAVLEQWLGVPSQEPLGGEFDALPLFRTNA